MSFIRHGFAPMQEDEPAPGVERRQLTGCAHDAEVVFYTIVDGGHEWPGDATLPDAGDGDSFSATEAILAFFDTHP